MLSGFYCGFKINERREIGVGFDPNNFIKLVCILESNDEIRES